MATETFGISLTSTSAPRYLEQPTGLRIRRLGGLGGGGGHQRLGDRNVPASATALSAGKGLTAATAISHLLTLVLVPVPRRLPG